MDRPVTETMAGDGVDMVRIIPDVAVIASSFFGFFVICFMFMLLFGFIRVTTPHPRRCADALDVAARQAGRERIAVWGLTEQKGAHIYALVGR